MEQYLLVGGGATVVVEVTGLHICTVTSPQQRTAMVLSVTGAHTVEKEAPSPLEVQYIPAPHSEEVQINNLS